MFSARLMAPRRKPPKMRPSLAQGRALALFEAAYYSVKGHTQETLEADVEALMEEHPNLNASFSISTYHSWKRQDSSPTVHDLEVLCRVTQERQTLIVDPQNSTADQGEDDVWTDETLNEIVLQLGRLPELARGKVLGEMKAKVDQAVVKENARNPQESDAAAGPAVVRRNK